MRTARRGLNAPGATIRSERAGSHTGNYARLCFHDLPFLLFAKHNAVRWNRDAVAEPNLILRGFRFVADDLTLGFRVFVPRSRYVSPFALIRSSSRFRSRLRYLPFSRRLPNLSRFSFRL